MSRVIEPRFRLFLFQSPGLRLSGSSGGPAYGMFGREWRRPGAGKQRVRVSMPSEPVFMAAGLFDENVDPKAGQKVGVFTMCTVPPNEFLGTVHDRAPMVLLPHQYAAWLIGGADALALVGTHPDVDAFVVKPV
jgi:putative SOS response-associated peptidase YedK